jgi:hypothetical protein
MFLFSFLKCFRDVCALAPKLGGWVGGGGGGGGQGHLKCDGDIRERN